MRLVEPAVEAIDTRRVTPSDVVDALEGAIEQGKVERAIAITESADGDLLLICTDMTNTDIVGTLSIAMQNYIHNFQHS